MLELGKQFRPSTSIVYPPFKKGRYMEEYFYEFYEHMKKAEGNRVYIPIFWTNLQIHPGFSKNKQLYELVLSNAMSKMPPNTKYFTVVQHDDGPQLKMKGDVLIFGACTGAIPLPLIYEDTDETLMNITEKFTKSNKYLASFIGTKTHPIRQTLYNTLIGHQDIYISTQENWSSSVPQHLANLFIDITLQSKFCLAPRGYGRSSFRFFEAMLLDTIPVYFWDDIEWLPYKDKIDYSTFSVSIQDISRTYEILTSISNEKYISMLEELKKVRHYFTLEGMSDYIMEMI